MKTRSLWYPITAMSVGDENRMLVHGLNILMFTYFDYIEERDNGGKVIYRCSFIGFFFLFKRFHSMTIGNVFFFIFANSNIKALLNLFYTSTMRASMIFLLLILKKLCILNRNLIAQWRQCLKFGCEELYHEGVARLI
jgi:hypothetical protein